MKNKNFTFEYTPSLFGNLDYNVAIDISSSDYVFTRTTDDSETFLFGPAINRLHEFEKFGMEPKEIERVLEDHHEHVAQLRGEIARLEAELEAKKKEQVDIHKLIDEVREKKDCYVHILIGDTYTSVDIRPDEPGLQRWITTTDKHHKQVFICPNCGFAEKKIGLYCCFCGEQLGAPKPEDPKPKKMTCREKLKEEHPEKINALYSANCAGCPHKYGYATKPDDCSKITCTDCWDREVEEK